MAQTSTNLPPAVAALVQQGILELVLAEALTPALLWRQLFDKQLHAGRKGELVIKSRDGLITPGDAVSAARIPGQDPTLVTESIEQFTYQVRPYANTIDIHIVSSYFEQTNEVTRKLKKMGTHAAMTLGRIARNALFAAYTGGNTFATTGATSTALVVHDATGFDTVLVNGSPVAVSSTNLGTLTIAGVTKTYNAVSLATNTITLAASTTWSQYDAVVRADAAIVQRQNARLSPRTLISSDLPTFATFRNAAAQMRNMNVPGIDGEVGGLYGCYIDGDVENALFTDNELQQAKAAIGITGVFAAGTIGVYAGIQFMRMPKSESIVLPASSLLQTPIHRSLMFGQGVGIEAYVPQAAFAAEVAAGGIPQPFADSNHYKMPIDDQGVLTMVLRAPIDKAGEIISCSWLGDVDYCIPTDSAAITGNQRYKRACVIETAGPA